MNFRANCKSKDCLHLNIRTPMKKANERLPVLVYFFGGCFQAGDGESMARKGIEAKTDQTRTRYELLDKIIN